MQNIRRYSGSFVRSTLHIQYSSRIYPLAKTPNEGGPESEYKNVYLAYYRIIYLPRLACYCHRRCNCCCCCYFYHERHTMWTALCARFNRVYYFPRFHVFPGNKELGPLFELYNKNPYKWQNERYIDVYLKLFANIGFFYAMESFGRWIGNNY